ncbi:hypothetical protein QEH59_13420 [Coraliomargarita sp. SDUM461004]|uniref:Uncharacterized protein n=1 Tax=Thalassobacterium sedimentorum TaxID=3041258 RepID=A0ABU1ANJ5_9BACT|nr:hypothetical protein [Coraliomargarita sp. SDUM461004]MDQ8195430.1 hypothetical protein [Coraliomargarita sp. SDUM461004]
MVNEVIESILRLIEAVFGYSIGEPDFNIVVGICVFAWVLAARAFMAIFSSKRGILAAFFAFAIPVTIGLVGYAMAELYVVPLMKSYGWRIFALPSAVFALFVFLSILLLAKRVWALSAGVSLFIYVVATAAAIGAYFGTEVTLGVIEYGENQMEQRDQRVKSEIDALL